MRLSGPIRLTLMMLVLCGMIYPLQVTGLAILISPHSATGSLVYDASGEPRGSELLGQSLGSPLYFHPRPSAGAYDGLASGGSSLGPASRRLYADVKSRVNSVRASRAARVPVDLVTASGSGLDPDVSPAGALAQVPRVSFATGVSEARLKRLVMSAVIPRQFGFLGEPRVNVLKLNILLAEEVGKAPGSR